MCVASLHLSRLQADRYNWVQWLCSTIHVRCAQLFHLPGVCRFSTILLGMSLDWDIWTKLLCPGYPPS